MVAYKAPLRELQFVREELLDYSGHYQRLPGCEEATPELVSAILEEAGRFCEEILAPLNQVGDQQGCRLREDAVETPAGFREAYQQYVEGGWPALAQPLEYGGQGLPESLELALSELLGEANWAWAMYPGLSHGAMNTLKAHGTEAQKQTYLKPLISGRWCGTMCLTEPHAGSDLALLKTRAEPHADGSYRLFGNKIFISAGEHDLAENIVHIVLARLPDAPPGTKGISLFIVPKFLPDSEGAPGTRNGVYCTAIEHKMGIHGNATCALSFDDATAFLIGPPHKGLSCMFTFMNMARMGTALQGLAHAEVAFQGALRYARERLQMRALNQAACPDLPADPILVHPDVRRMLLTIKALSEGNRALLYYTERLVDQVACLGDGDERARADLLLGFLTPICKAFVTETGFECANLGMQVFGGHGYIRDWGMEQQVRDARISTIYEGTTGIQALDLLGRKVLLSRGAPLKRFCAEIGAFCQAHRDHQALAAFLPRLAEVNKSWQEITLQIGMQALKNREEVGAAAYDYLMLSGYICLAYLWADMARVAAQALASDTEEQDFYRGKLETARFFYQRILPRADLHLNLIRSGSSNLMTIDSAQLGPEL